MIRESLNRKGHLMPTNQKTVLERIRRDKVLLLFCLPCVVWMIVFCYIPIGGLVIAFQDFKLSKGIWSSPWVGFTYFEQFFTSARSLKVLRNTICLSLIKLGFGFFIPITFAMLLHEVQNKKLLRITQTVSYMPHFLSWSICTLLFSQLFNPSGGILMNTAANLFGFEPVNLFSIPTAVWPLAFFTEIWKETGWNSIIYLAALSGVSAELYEAGELDGATRWQRMWHISLPSILPTICIILIMNTGGIMNSNFDQMWLMRNSANLSFAEVIDTYVYQRAIFDLKYSFGTAVGMFKSVINVVLLLLTNTIVRKIGQESLF